MRSLWFGIVVVLLLCVAQISAAKINIPTNLSAQDRRSALEILGMGSSMKILGDTFPLGGYSGVEFGLTNEVISTAEISRLGAKSPQQGEISYSVLTFGKGLYNNLDLFLQFTPFGQSEEISNFGAMVRYGFFQGEYLPVHLSLNLHGTSTNFQNLIVANTQGLDLVSGFNVDDVTLYFGAGYLKTQGTFMGGAGGVTSTGETLNESLNDTHYLVGLNLKFNKWFLALEINRYTQPAYSAKVGYRF
ncbi:MAG: hypothetical protein BroJett040_22510 [Oligoflexia bacterium]|nr:MAG: hypothetical protein BroJett040_22510 [Oligoflexia bacterium]